MKNLILAVLAMALTTSCISQEVRDNALVPGAQLAFVGVRADIERGLADAVEDGELANREPLDAELDRLRDALDNDAPRAEMRTIPWEVLRPYGDRGIQDRVDDGEIDPLIAPSLIQRLDNFEAAVFQLRLTYIPAPPSRGRAFNRSMSIDTPTGTETVFTTN